MSLGQHIYERGCKCPETCPYHPQPQGVDVGEAVADSAAYEIYTTNTRIEGGQLSLEGIKRVIHRHLTTHLSTLLAGERQARETAEAKLAKYEAFPGVPKQLLDANAICEERDALRRAVSDATPWITGLRDRYAKSPDKQWAVKDLDAWLAANEKEGGG